MADDTERSHGPYTARILPPDEWDARAHELLHYPALPDPAGAILCVVEDAQRRIVASWYAINTVHLEGLYIEPVARLNPAVARLLSETLINECRARHVPAVLTQATSPSILAMARKRGFEIVPGTLLQLALPLG